MAAEPVERKLAATFIALRNRVIPRLVVGMLRSSAMHRSGSLRRARTLWFDSWDDS